MLLIFDLSNILFFVSSKFFENVISLSLHSSNIFDASSNFPSSNILILCSLFISNSIEGDNFISVLSTYILDSDICFILKLGPKIFVKLSSFGKIFISKTTFKSISLILS